MTNKKKTQQKNQWNFNNNRMVIMYEYIYSLNSRTQKLKIKPIAISNKQFIPSLTGINSLGLHYYLSNLGQNLTLMNKKLTRCVSDHILRKQTNFAQGFVIMTGFVIICFFFIFVLLGIKSIGPLIIESITGFGKWLLTIFIPMAIIISSISVILVTNPIYGLIGLILVFVNTALFLISIQIQFLAFIYLIVYIGAIAILFLFVIMLFNLKSLQKNKDNFDNIPFLEPSFFIYFLCLIKFLIVISVEIRNFIENCEYHYHAITNQFNIQYQVNYVNFDIGLFSNLFYTYYRYIFLIAGLLLLVSMIGSIVLALSTYSMEAKKKN